MTKSLSNSNSPLKTRTSLAKVLRHLFTESDNETYDTSRTVFLVSFVFALCFSAADFYVNKVFKLQDFGVAIATMSAAFGLSKKLEGDILDDKPQK
jgi:hypothetical protein